MTNEKGTIRVLSFTCLKCDQELLPKEQPYPFGEEIKCPKCKTLYEVEYDYSGDDYGCISFYLVEKKD